MITDIGQYSEEDLKKHPPENVTVPKYPLPPTGVPPLALHFTDPTVHADPWKLVSNATNLAARRAYRAAVTGMDRKLGVLLAELETLGLANTTAIVVHGDHGGSHSSLSSYILL